jgi:uncharacterized protein (TIGR03067 family)
MDMTSFPVHKKKVTIMNYRLLKTDLWIIGAALCASTAAAAPDQGYQELRGTWQAIELVDNGRVIPAEAIPGWVPSGGRMEIVDNTMVFTSPKDGQRHARVFSIDATTYPRQLNVLDKDQVAGHGIYRFDDGRLIVCLSSATGTPRPSEFSAREGSQRMLMVLVRPDSKPTSATNQPQAASTSAILSLPASTKNVSLAHPPTKPLSNSDVGALLPGTWKCKDLYGDFFITLDKRGTYSTYRESVETSALQKVFRKLPVSSGTWKLNNGQVVLRCTSAVHADRIYKSFPFTVRSVTPTELEFVDFAGNVSKAVRSQP